MKATATLALIFGTLAWSQAIPLDDAVERIRQSGRARSPVWTWQRPVRPAQNWLPAGHDGPCSVRMPAMDSMRNWQGDPKMATAPATPQTMAQAAVPAPPCPAK